MKIVFLDRESLDRGDLDFSGLDGLDAEVRYHASTPPELVAERIMDAQIVVTNKVVLDRGLIDGARRLTAICVAATGTNNVDLQAAADRGIHVSNVTGYATASVVQHVFALITSLQVRLLQQVRAVRRGDWTRATQFCLLDYPFHELAGKTLGIVGYGELGRAVARAAQAFGMQVMISQRPGAAAVAVEPVAAVRRYPLEQVLRNADVLSLHCPLAPNTQHLVDRHALALMKPGALLINTARGGLVDEQALAEALRHGRLGGAGLDVLSREPPEQDNPLLSLDLPNLIVTPHIAWASIEARQRLLSKLISNIKCALGLSSRA